jgi:carbon monoxide dehydrogenase subunit G
MEIDVERYVRIIAPLKLAWEEIDSLEQILAKTPQASGYDVVPGGKRATGTSKLVWGPMKRTLEVEFSLHDLRPREHLRYVMEVGSLGLRYEATFDLSTLGHMETKLDYRGHLESRNGFASRMRGLLNEIVEEHACGVVSRVKVKAEQRRLAQERL